MRVLSSSRTAKAARRRSRVGAFVGASLGSLAIGGVLLIAATVPARASDPGELPRRPVFNLMSASPVVARLAPNEPAKIVVIADDARIAILDSRGYALPGWPVNAGGRLTGSPVVADLDGDGHAEVYAASDRGILRFDQRGDSLDLQMPRGNLHFLPPVVGDVTGDGRPELASAATEGVVAVWGKDGRLLAGWPKTAGSPFMGQCAIADVDGAPGGEIIAGDSRGTLRVWTGKGQDVDQWPITLESPVRVSAASLHLPSGTAAPLIATFDEDGWVRAFDRHAASLDSWPAETRGLVNEPITVTDLDRDGSPEVVVTHRDGTIMVVHADAILDPRWPRDAHGTVRYGALAADVTGDGAPEILVVTDDRQIWAFRDDGTEAPGWPRDLPRLPAGRPAAGDIDGDGRNEIVLAVQSGELLVFETDGLAGEDVRGVSRSDPLRLWQNLPTRNAYENALEFVLPANAPPVTLDLLDGSGDRAAVLIDARSMPPGRSVITNPGKSQLPRVAPGEYTARLVTGTDTLRTPVLVLR